MTREDDRYNAAFLAHEEVAQYFQPYAELLFHGRQVQRGYRAGTLFKDSNPLDPLTNNYNVNCNNPLMSAQQQSILCTPGADCGRKRGSQYRLLVHAKPRLAGSLAQLHERAHRPAQHRGRRTRSGL